MGEFERYDSGDEANPSMCEHADGDWVRYEDAKALASRVEELEAELERMDLRRADVAGQRDFQFDLAVRLEAELAAANGLLDKVGAVAEGKTKYLRNENTSFQCGAMWLKRRTDAIFSLYSPRSSRNSSTRAIISRTSITSALKSTVDSTYT